MKTRKIVCVVGTRPEAIKMAPVIRELKKSPDFITRVLATGQHREMLDKTLELFDIAPDIDLDVMRPAQDLSSLTARVLSRFTEEIAKEAPDAVLAQGDTTTVFATALACFYHKIPFCHVEAGLRTGDFYNPFPEEMNRAFVGRLASLHFAPTERAQANLLAEGVPEASVFVTGNTVIDAVHWMANANPNHNFPVLSDSRFILMTCHRRENFGEPLNNIFNAVKRLASLYPDVRIVYPVHPNPSVYEPAQSILGGIDNVVLTDALDYPQLVALMKSCYFVLTDSGGIQEEAPAFAKPVLILREETERPEGVDAGVAKIVGSNPNEIIRSCQSLLDHAHLYDQMARAVSPYGDGSSAQKIVAALREF